MPRLTDTPQGMVGWTVTCAAVGRLDNEQGGLLMAIFNSGDEKPVNFTVAFPGGLNIVLGGQYDIMIQSTPGTGTREIDERSTGGH